MCVLGMYVVDVLDCGLKQADLLLFEVMFPFLSSPFLKYVAV